jgi:ribosomal protein S18 acetylase RimI-like enzyme
MASITVPIQAPQTGNLRPLNIIHDLPEVADLIELCFASTMDDDGQSYLQQMRRAGHDQGFLNWAGKMVDSTSMPLAGFVWEENGKIIGNVSLVYQTYAGKKMAMLANIATHPDYRRHGISQSLTEKAMIAARQKGARDLWLQVRDDNPTAIKIYTDLGFSERARRTTYYSRPGGSQMQSKPLLDPKVPNSQLETAAANPAAGIIIAAPLNRQWPQQHAWLERAHPSELSWYAHWEWNTLAPGLGNWLRRILEGTEGRQWGAIRNGNLLAVVHWMPLQRSSNALWPAAPVDGDGVGLSLALEAARRDLSHYRRLALEYPAGEMLQAIEAAGFALSRTLLWMHAGATSGPVARMDSRKERT